MDAHYSGAMAAMEESWRAVIQCRQGVQQMDALQREVGREARECMEGATEARMVGNEAEWEGRDVSAASVEGTCGTAAGAGQVWAEGGMQECRSAGMQGEVKCRLGAPGKDVPYA